MTFIAPDEIRSRFSAALSEMYRSEVPLYGELLRVVADVNGRAGAPHPAPRIAVERHGAIRLGAARELAAIARLFAIMGMFPVGYYDLAPAGVPVHSTAFRPVSDGALARNPFRMFTSLLRLDLIENAKLRTEAERILARRTIIRPATMSLIERAENEGGLNPTQAEQLVAGAIDIFRWNAEAPVSRPTYERLHAAHPLIADVVCFGGPHVNHLTPRTLDIDAAHRAMRDAGMAPKASIEGPPRRAVPILLRQTSFRAREEAIRFAGEPGTHTARFGEIEQRGAALTPKGRALYDAALASGQPGALSGLPDDFPALRRLGLVFCRYRRIGEAAPPPDLETAILGGTVAADPITYEDFLPVSAAGIFRSNLAGSGSATTAVRPASRTEFETALGTTVGDEMALYAAAEAASLAAL